MKRLTPEMEKAIVDQVKFEPQVQRRIDNHTGEIREGYRAHIKFGFECDAKDIGEAREVILREATKYFNGILNVT